MPPWILAAIPAFFSAFAVAVAGALFVGPFALPLYFRTLSRMDRERLLAATKGAFFVVSELAKRTHTSLDDDVAKVVKMVEQELAKSLSVNDKKLVENVARAFHADPAYPNLSEH
jgi:hypothetical protein